MKIPIESQQFAARLTSEDLTLINEILPELLPDRDLTDSTITGREILMAMAETASLKLRKQNQARPEDSEKINQFIAENNRLSEETVTLTRKLKEENEELAVNIQLIDQLTQLVAETRTELTELQQETEQIKEKASKLEKYVPVTNEMRIVLEPLTSKVLVLYAEKIRLKNRSEIQPGDILTSLFIRYITKRETEFPGFPFLISKQEIANLANEQ
ncbi:MAG: hypothetical protein Q8R96_11630 [Bacteroidota bacterium]|nr:hypothetical protein [Bacteroidota bacterium]